MGLKPNGLFFRGERKIRRASCVVALQYWHGRHGVLTCDNSPVEYWVRPSYGRGLSFASGNGEVKRDNDCPSSRAISLSSRKRG